MSTAYRTPANSGTINTPAAPTPSTIPPPPPSHFPLHPQQQPPQQPHHLLHHPQQQQLDPSGVPIPVPVGLGIDPAMTLRFDGLLAEVRAEFEHALHDGQQKARALAAAAASGAPGAAEAAVGALTEDYRIAVQAHERELGMLRQNFVELEGEHMRLKRAYEEELHHLRAQLDARHGPPVPGQAPPPGMRPPGSSHGLGVAVHAPLPSGGPPPAFLFAGQGGGGGPGQGPPPTGQREREREETRGREWERERERERERRDEREPGFMNGHGHGNGAGPPLGAPRPQPSMMGYGAGAGQGQGQGRDHEHPAKRMRTEDAGPQPPMPPPPPHPEYSVPTPPPQKGKPYNPKPAVIPPGGPPGPPPSQAGPSSNTLPSHTHFQSSSGAYGPAGPLKPGTPGPYPGPGGGAVIMAGTPTSAPAAVMEDDGMSAMKKEGIDWESKYSRRTGRTLDVELVHTLPHESVVCCVKFSPDGKILATGSNRNTYLYDTGTGAKITTLIDEGMHPKADNYIRSVCFSPDGKLLATGSEDRVVRIWEVAKKRLLHVLSGHRSEIYSLVFSPDGKTLVSGSGDKTARLWSVDDGKVKLTLTIDEEPALLEAGVTSVSLSPDGRWLACGSLDMAVRIWDATTGKLIEKLSGHKDSVYSVAWSPDAKFLVSGSLDKTLKKWDVTGIVGMAALANGEKLANGGNGEAARKGSGSGSAMMDVDVKEEAMANGDLRPTVCRETMAQHKDYVLSVTMSPEGNYIVSGSKDRSVCFWESKTGIPHYQLFGHRNSVISIAVSDVGGLLATGSGDWQARVWRYEPIVQGAGQGR